MRLQKSRFLYELTEGSLTTAAYAAKKSDQTTAHTDLIIIQEVFPMVIWNDKS